MRSSLEGGRRQTATRKDNSRCRTEGGGATRPRASPGEVFCGQAQKTELSWSALTGATRLTREQYVRRRIEEFVKDPQEREALRKNGPPLGRWDRYLVRYAWQPVFVHMPLLDERIDLILHFNGERQHMPFPLSAAAVAAPRPGPDEI